jgi:hypothetical protein
VLWLPVAPAGHATVTTDTVHIVAYAARGAEVGDTCAQRHRRAPAAALPPPPFVVTAEPLVIEPPAAITPTVLERRYLRNCALLC